MNHFLHQSERDAFGNLRWQFFVGGFKYHICTMLLSKVVFVILCCISAYNIEKKLCQNYILGVIFSQLLELHSLSPVMGVVCQGLHGL